MDLLSWAQPSFDARLQYGPQASQFGELRLPKGPGPHPVIVGIHGGWWRAAHGLETHSHLCAALTEAGFATWNIEYRRIGEDGGGWPGTLADAGQAIDFLRSIAPRYQLDIEAVVTVGFSAGGQLALWAAGRHRLDQRSLLHADDPLQLAGAISLAGAVDLTECARLRLSNDIVAAFLGGLREDFPERYMESSPIELLPLGVPHALIHGTDDTSVPHEISLRHHARALAQKDACDLQLLEGVQHFELIDPRTHAFGVLLNQIQKYLHKDGQ
jgi:acetyl esterase/lipase